MLALLNQSTRAQSRFEPLVRRASFRFHPGRFSVKERHLLTRGASAGPRPTGYSSTLSHDYSLRFEFHYETRADTELTDPLGDEV